MSNETPSRKWESSISYYRSIISLEFSTEEDNFSALERLCGPLYGLPYMPLDENTIIIPAEAENEFADLSYIKQKASWAAESRMEYSQKKSS